MVTLQDPDLNRSASHRHMIAHLTGPLQAGAVDTPLPIQAGRVTLDWATREPLLLAAPRRPLGDQQMILKTNLPDATEVMLKFFPYTEAGAYLPLYRPSVKAATASITLELSLELGGSPVPVDEIADHIEIRLLEGLMGRMIYLLGAEKQRLRRQGREIVAMRHLDLARDDALDRIGAELGVPRFNETIEFIPAEEIELPPVFGEFRFGDRYFGPGSRGHIETRPGRETDNDYRRRLAIYRPLLMPNRQTVVERLNGPGEAPKNTGLLSGLGLTHRFSLEERDNDFAFAIHLIASDLIESGDDTSRSHFFDHIRQCHLIWPSESDEAEAIHRVRYLPTLEKERINALRHRLRLSFTFAKEAAIAPMLAIALDRLGRCRRALGDTSRWPIQRAQDATGGSRYELGLGVDVPLLSAAELNQMGDRLRANHFTDSLVSESDPNPQETAGLLKDMIPLAASEDPEGCWLLEPCGLRTVHHVLAGSREYLYLSHLPIFGMVISGPTQVALTDQAALTVKYYPPGDTEGSIVLVKGLVKAAAAWRGNPWTQLTREQAQASHVLATPEPAATVFRGAGLPVVPSLEMPLAAIQSQLQAVTASIYGRLFVVLRLHKDQASQILSGQLLATVNLRALVKVLNTHGITSILPLVTDQPNEVLLVVGPDRPQAVTPSTVERRTLSFRWYAVPIGIRGSGGGSLTQSRDQARFSPKATGLTALIAVGYARLGLTDPYEFRVELPAAARLDLLQYEFLMNLLQHLHPLGIGINTYDIRQRHVDLDGDGTPEPLSPNISRTYRQFRRHHHRGETLSISET